MGKTQNILAGAGSVLQIFPSTQGRATPYVPKDDGESLAGDWRKVGNDLRTAINKTRGAKEAKK